jgi:hypothetical protein
LLAERINKFDIIISYQYTLKLRLEPDHLLAISYDITRKFQKLHLEFAFSTSAGMLISPRLEQGEMLALMT